MNLYQQSKQKLYQGAKTVNKTFEKNSVKKMKRVIIIIFALLLILDVVFVMETNAFPTISRVVLLSSPKSLYIIFIWGVATANLFFPRKVKYPFTIKIIGLVGLIIITTLLVIIGFKISAQSDDLACGNSTTTPTTLYTEIICYNSNNKKIDCVKCAPTCDYVRIDLTTPAKATLVIAGILFGYLFWPQMERKPHAA